MKEAINLLTHFKQPSHIAEYLDERIPHDANIPLIVTSLIFITTGKML